MSPSNMDSLGPVGTKESAQIFEDENPQKPVPAVHVYDRFGAHEKTDPKEIALVKKLDRWIMVRPPISGPFRGQLIY
jgi:hypothetical protein